MKLNPKSGCSSRDYVLHVTNAMLTTVPSNGRRTSARVELETTLPSQEEQAGGRHQSIKALLKFAAGQDVLSNQLGLGKWGGSSEQRLLPTLGPGE